MLKYIPQPRWLQKLYYKSSYYIWGHPSNGHWKKGSFGCTCIPICGLRCLWCGCYYSDCYSKEEIKISGFIPDPTKKVEYYRTMAQQEKLAWKNLQWKRKKLRWLDKLLKRY